MLSLLFISVYFVVVNKIYTESKKTVIKIWSEETIMSTTDQLLSYTDECKL